MLRADLIEAKRVMDGILVDTEDLDRGIGPTAKAARISSTCVSHIAGQSHGATLRVDR